jgi:hypothetical protein
LPPGDTAPAVADAKPAASLTFAATAKIDR